MPIKIRIPFIIENGVSGLVLTSFIGGLFHINGIFPDYFVIKNNTIIHTSTKKIFSIQGVKSIIVHEIELVPVTKDLKLDFYKPAGKEIKLFLENDIDEKIQILPSFQYSVQEWGKKDWKRFLNELSTATSLPVEFIKDKEKT